MSANTVLFCLKLLAILMQIAIVIGVVHLVRGRYAFPAWQHTWYYLLAAMVVTTIRRIQDLQDDLSLMSMLTVVVAVALMLRWVWQLVKLYALPLTLRNPTIPARITIDGFSTILAWDHEAERLFGWTAAETVGQTLMQTIIPPQEWESHREGMARVQAREVPVPIDRLFPGLTACCKDGGSIPIELHITGQYVADRGWEFHGEIRLLIRL